MKKTAIKKIVKMDVTYTNIKTVKQQTNKQLYKASQQAK